MEPCEDPSFVHIEKLTVQTEAIVRTNISKVRRNSYGSSASYEAC